MSLPSLIGFLGSHGGINTAEAVAIYARRMCELCNSVLILDFHSGNGDNPDLAALFQAENEPGLADVLMAQKPLLECIQPIQPGLDLSPGAWGLDLLPGDLNKSIELLVHQIAQTGNRWNQVLFDLGTSANRLTNGLWKELDQAVIVTTNENEAILNAYATIKIHASLDNNVRIALIVVPSHSPNVSLEQAQERLTDACQRFLGIELVDPTRRLCTHRDEVSPS